MNTLEQIHASVMDTVKKILEEEDVHIFEHTQEHEKAYERRQGKLNVGIPLPMPSRMDLHQKPPLMSHINIEIHIYDDRYYKRGSPGPMDLISKLLDNLHEQPIHTERKDCSTLQLNEQEPLIFKSNTNMSRHDACIRCYCSMNSKIH